MQRNIRTTLKWFLGLGLSFFCICALAVLLIPHAWLSHLVGEKASAGLDREVAIDGPVHIGWHWIEPEVHLEKIRIANMKGAADPNMVEIASLDFRIRLWKLLEGQLNLPDVRIVKPKIILQKNAQGDKNWNFHTVSKANVVTSAALPSSRFNFPMIGALRIDNGTLVYKDDTKNLSLALDIDTAIGAGGTSDTFRLNGDGKIQDKIFKLDAVGGSLDMLRNSHEAYPLDLHITMGKTAIAVKGTFTDPVKMADIDASLDLHGDNLADLFYLTLIPLPPSPAYTLSGHLKKDGEVWKFTGFKGAVGKSDMQGQLIYDTTKQRGFVQADLDSKLLRMDDLSGLIGIKPDTQQTSVKTDRLLPDMDIDLSRLRSTDMDITLKADRLEQPGWPFDDFVARFNLADGVLRVDPLSFGVAQGKITGSLILDGRQEVPDVTSDLVVHRISLKPFFSDSRFEPFAAGYFGGRFQLKGNGKSLAEVLGDSDGRVTLLMTKGTISKLIVDAAGLDIGKAAPALLGKDQSTGIRCAIGDFGVKNGLMTSDIFLFDTTASNIHGYAVINLKNETIDAQLEAHPKEASVTARTPIDITGRLKSPDIGLDPKELSERGLAAAALSFLGGVAAIIPFIDLGLGKDSDCKDLIDEAKAHSGVNPPAQ